MRMIILGSLILGSINLQANDCITNRAAFDIGSGSTKLKVAKVDTCAQKVIKILHESSRAVSYKQSLKESKRNRLRKNIINEGINKLRELKDEAQKFSPSSYTAVATSAFRTAKNGKKAAKRISKKLGFKINIITQEQEAKIGFAGASAVSDVELKNILVWDIGGGSMQMTSYEGNGKYTIYKGKLASVSFKNHLIEEVQQRNTNTTTSPNPISKVDYQVSLRDAKVHAKNTVPKAIIDKLLSGNIQVIGIGGVHYHSIGKAVSDSKTYSLDMVKNHTNKSLDLSDEQLGGGKYVDTNVSNLILVAGFMEGLNIKSVKTAKINMADGLLVMPSLASQSN